MSKPLKLNKFSKFLFKIHWTYFWKTTWLKFLKPVAFFNYELKSDEKVHTAGINTVADSI